MRETRTLDLVVAGRAVSTPCDVAGAGPEALLLPALSTIASRAEMRGLADALITEKTRITRQPRARFGTAAFVTGGLDPVPTREAFLALFGQDHVGQDHVGEGLPPIRMLRPERAPPRWPTRSGRARTELAMRE